MKKVLLFFLVLTIFSLDVFSQKAPLKWKKLTKEEIDLKVYNDNPNIPAVIFYDYGQMYFDLNPNGKDLFLFRKRHVRMKILNEEGLKYAKVRFVYDDMSCEYLSGELSFSVRAVTHNILENGKIKTVKLKYKDIKHSDSTGCLKIAEFEFPNVKVGSILEYEVTIPTLKLINPDTWYFQKELPVIYSEFRAKVPSDFKYIFSVKNVESLTVKDSAYFDKIINYIYNYYGKYYKTTFNLSGIEYRFVNKYMPIIRNKKEAEKINIHLKFINSRKYNDVAWRIASKALMVTTLPDYVNRTPSQRETLRYPVGYYTYYLPTWKELNESLLLNNKFSLSIIKKCTCDSVLNTIINGNQSEMEKVKAIYDFVKANIKWNGKYSLYAEISDNFIKKRSGSSSEINFFLMHLLYKAKIKVYPVLVNTIDNECVDRTIPDINQFKTVVALINIDGNEYLLDAVLPESKFLEISSQYDNKQMFVVRKEAFGWLK
ncbi:MAG: DUF3857 domain-containing protein [Chlorobi bacterium]|nr:DUF3857 domain-containing protein [Chlorobiota bacterium]